MNIAQPNLVPSAAEGAIPRDYNFAADILSATSMPAVPKKLPYIDPRGGWTYGELAGRVDALRPRAALARHPPRGAHPHLPPRQHRLADRLPRRDQGRRGPGAGQHAHDRGRLRFMLADSRARLLVVSEELYPKFAGLIGACENLEQVIVSGEKTHGHPRFEDLLAGAGAKPATAPTVRDEICFWLYTSGSTGKPKGAVHTHADLKLTDELYAKPFLGIAESDVVLLGGKAVLRLRAGQRAHLPDVGGSDDRVAAGAADAGAGGRYLKKAPGHRLLRRADVLCRLSRQPRTRRSDATLQLRALRFCRRSAAGRRRPPLERALRRRHSRRHRLDRDAAYLHLEPPRRGEVRHHRQAGARLRRSFGRRPWRGGKKPGEMGELQVRGPTSAVMYWNNREQSRTTFLGEWTRSGDKYVEDEQGYFVYCGRRDDMLKVSGIYVSPFEVEAALQSHPEVLEVAVVGWPDDDALIKPKAFVVLKSPEKASDELERALQDYCRQKLAVFKYPRWLEFRTELPKTATGKIQRFKLRAEAETH